MEKAAFVFVLKEGQIYEFYFSLWFFFNSIAEHHVFHSWFAMLHSYQNEVEEKRCTHAFSDFAKRKHETPTGWAKFV